METQRLRKIVYLFELDSERRTDEEIAAGQNALYREIVRNGNVVVLTYNQLVDSRGFFTLLNTPSYRESLLELFARGSIRISRFGRIRTIVQYLDSLLQTVLKLSMMQSAYLPPRNPEEYQNLRLRHFLEQAMGLTPPENAGLWNRAVEILRALPCLGGDNCSDYIRQIRSAVPEGASEEEKMPFRYAVAIVRLAYNYACEASIQGVSKHYNPKEITENPADKPTFSADFFSRLAQDWTFSSPEGRFLRDENNSFETFGRPDLLPDFSEACRLCGYVPEELTNGGEEKAVPPGRVRRAPRYEYRLIRQRRQQKNRLLLAIGGQVLLSLGCVLAVCILEFGFQFAQEMADAQAVLTRIPGWSILETLLFLLAAEWITSLVSDRWPWISSLSEALGSFRQLFRDAVLVCRGREETYCSRCRIALEKTESFGDCATVTPLSDALRQYRALERDPHFAPLL